MTHLKNIIVIYLICVFEMGCRGWRAVPANQAMYAQRSRHAGIPYISSKSNVMPDELLPRTFLHSIFKFGWCRPTATKRQFLRKSINLTLPDFQSTQGNYLYLLVDKHSQRFALQCVVMKIYVPEKFLFRRSRLPVYYCQGILRYLMLNTIQKMEIHEFYLYKKLNLPADFVFEFYQPEIL